MNKQELIEELKKVGIYRLDIFGTDIEGIPTKSAICLIEQLDEPEKVKVPQFVAGWIKYCKLTSVNLYHALEMGDLYFCNYANQKDYLKLKEFFEVKGNQDLFARAWLDGYEVEEEPKYTVKFKATNQYLCDDDGIGLHISPSFRSNFRKSDLEKLSLTEVFDSPLFEVEEVNN